MQLFQPTRASSQVTRYRPLAFDCGRRRHGV